MISEILLIRHGEAYNNTPPEASDESRDLINPPLTALGERQARELKPLVLAFAPEAVIVSPFLRTVQTLYPSVTPEIRVSVDRRIGERIFASVFTEFRGIELSHYQTFGPRLIPDALCRERSAFPDYPETRESVRARVASLWEEWDNAGVSRVAFVGHGASLAALLNLILPEYPNNTGHVNCGVSHLEKTPTGWVARSINRHDHLTRTGAAVGT